MQRTPCTQPVRCRAVVSAITIGLATILAAPLHAAVVTNPTLDADALAAALHPTGLTVISATIRNGVAGQFGMYSNFELQPATIRPGVVLSSGDVTNMGPFEQPPGYSDPASGSVPNVTDPPAQVNSQMDPAGLGGTAEFNAYGLDLNSQGRTRIENFQHSHDVAALEINFHLDNASPVKFDFIFASVEYPYWTSQYTDAFLVFLDGTAPGDQVTFDANLNPVQVGVSFADLVLTSDQNTAFSAPHGMIHHLTTTTAELADGEHTLIFEVGDVNDGVLDSAAFITNLRAEAGTEGTEPSDDVPEPAALALLLLVGSLARRRAGRV